MPLLEPKGSLPAMTADTEPPFILCGLGRIGFRVLDYLRAAGLSVVAVDTRCAVDDPRLGEVRLVQGDCRRQDVLEAAGVRQAQGVLIMTSDDLVNISTTLMVRYLNPDVRIVMRMFNQNLLLRLGKAVHRVHALSTSKLTAPLFALTALTGQALGTVVLEGLEDGLRQVAELTITVGSPLRGLTVGEAAQRYSMLVLAHHPSGGKTRLLLDVDPTAHMHARDRLIVCAEPQTLMPLLEGTEGALPNVHWAGWLRRMTRVVWRTFSEVELPVKICTSVLVGVIVISTLVFRLTVHYRHGLAHEERFAEAFFRTISLVATGADMRADDLKDDWQQVFASTLRIVGAVLTAAFTAIVTNYLLRARLGQALEVRRIPDSGHIVVCGLGNLGFRVVEELVKLDERVVVIETARDSRFVATARRLGVAVLIGDATVGQVLRQAHAGEARAVVAATSNDLINLEVALMVREINPEQRVVLRLTDPNLAQTLREAANVRLALSITMLSAPAFVAALFGDRVQSVFMIDGRLLAAVDVVVPERDACLSGQSVRALSFDYQLLPVAVLDAGGTVVPEPLDARLEAKYRLVALAALPDLERLLRREPVPADSAVEVVSFTPRARPALVSELVGRKGMLAESAEKALDRLPVRLAAGLTAGQAKELVMRLGRDGITAEVRLAEGQAGTSA
jgi:Trk K+ transport system NAD-binding subunit